MSVGIKVNVFPPHLNLGSLNSQSSEIKLDLKSSLRTNCLIRNLDFTIKGFHHPQDMREKKPHTATKHKNTHFHLMLCGSELGRTKTDIFLALLVTKIPN